MAAPPCSEPTSRPVGSGREPPRTQRPKRSPAGPGRRAVRVQPPSPTARRSGPRAHRPWPGAPHGRPVRPAAARTRPSPHRTSGGTKATATTKATSVMPPTSLIVNSVGWSPSTASTGWLIANPDNPVMTSRSRHPERSRSPCIRRAIPHASIVRRRPSATQVHRPRSEVIRGLETPEPPSSLLRRVEGSGGDIGTLEVGSTVVVLTLALLVTRSKQIPRRHGPARFRPRRGTPSAGRGPRSRAGTRSA